MNASSTDTNSYNFDVCDYDVCGGQANYETTMVQSVANNQSSSWGSDFSDFVNATGAWAIKGGYTGTFPNVGLFDSRSFNGIGFDFFGWRAVLHAEYDPCTVGGPCRG
jgi:hypothetical protein